MALAGQHTKARKDDSSDYLNGQDSSNMSLDSDNHPAGLIYFSGSAPALGKDSLLTKPYVTPLEQAFAAHHPNSYSKFKGSKTRTANWVAIIQESTNDSETEVEDLIEIEFDNVTSDSDGSPKAFQAAVLCLESDQVGGHISKNVVSELHKDAEQFNVLGESQLLMDSYRELASMGVPHNFGHLPLETDRDESVPISLTSAKADNSPIGGTPGRSGSRTPMHFNSLKIGLKSHGAAHYSTPSPRHRQYQQDTKPGEWVGDRFGDISYVFLPAHLLHLEYAGNQWTYGRTSPMSNCHNRVVGDIYFAPGEVEGFTYWVCCEMNTEFGLDWVDWELGSAHPESSDLVLQHTSPDVPLQWTGCLEL
ncbi:hypothetical protein FS749_012088 [Ceratobasidium sp. UAMH 11750]|nr:hypothetical protein FS749_012088 [Ceratobasidium sp. UAMH 11750]